VYVDCSYSITFLFRAAIEHGINTLTAVNVTSTVVKGLSLSLLLRRRYNKSTNQDFSGASGRIRKIKS
jgi:hypothetical protein